MKKEDNDPFGNLLKQYTSLTIFSQVIFFLPILLLMILVLGVFMTILTFYYIDFGIRLVLGLKTKKS